jgi:putative endonuclease
LNSWYVYILRCADDSLYTGITTDIERRLLEHNNGAPAAKYTRSRRPVTLVYLESAQNRSSACVRENQIKQLKRSQKHKLLANYCP